MTKPLWNYSIQISFLNGGCATESGDRAAPPLFLSGRTNMVTILICVLLIPGILLVMDEGVFFPVSNLVGLMMVIGACLLGWYREEKRRWIR